MRCEAKDAKPRMHHVHPIFSFWSAEICELKDYKARTHNLHSGFYPLSLFLGGW